MNHRPAIDSWLQSFPTTVTRALMQQLQADLKMRIRYARARHNDAHRHVAGNILLGARRPHGRPRLMLTPERLVQHMDACVRRTDAHHELAVLVPLARRVSAALQQWRENRPAPIAALDATLLVLRRTLPYPDAQWLSQRVPRSAARFEFVSPAEQRVAFSLAQQHPGVFFPSPQPPEPSADSGNRKQALLRKIVRRIPLSQAELQLLKQARSATSSAV